MKKLVKIFSSFIGAAAVFAACQPDNLIETPEFVLTDASGTEIISLTSSGNYTHSISSNQQATSANSSQEREAAAIFTVRSNVDWRIEPAEDGQDWCRAFPDCGSADGTFRFLVERNNDQTAGRTAYYNVFINDGATETRLSSMIVVDQSANVDFLRSSVATLEILKEGENNKRVVITSNVEWTYNIEPNPDYATENIDWIEDKTVHPQDQKIDTVLLSFADNTGGTIRGARLNITVPGNETLNRTIAVTQTGEDVEVTGFPVQWIIGIGPENVNFNTTFPNSGYIDAVSGGGRITYVEGEGKSDPDAKFTRVVGSGGDPYVTGAWPGDYWEFKSDSPVSAGTILQIKFQAATSAKGHKFWRLEYRDGEDWIVPSSLRQTTSEPGSEIVYTHIMQPSSSTKVDVQATVKLNNTTDAAHFRLVCAANWQSGGNGALDKPNGGTMRLSLADAKADNEWQPVIRCVAAGSEDLTPANISVSGIDGGVITFEGDPGDAAATFTVVSDTDFNIVPSVSWLHVTPASGIAGESVQVTVTCDPSTLSQLRRGTVDIKAGITTYSVNVIQSAAGGELEPLISVVGGNSVSVESVPETYSVKVQANVPVTYASDVDWITVSPAPATRAVVETSEYTYSVTQNWASQPRVGHITFSNADEGLESVLTVTQSKFEVVVSAPSYVYIPSTTAEHNIALTTNAPLTVSTSASWLSVTAASVGTDAQAIGISVTEANSTATRRTADITLANIDAGFSQTITIAQSASGTVFSEDFEWLGPWTEARSTGDAVGTNNHGTDAPQVGTPKVNGVSALQAFEALGYQFLRVTTKTEEECIYLQKNYLKFGKTSYQAGIVFPDLSIAAGKYQLEFDWCPQRQGSGKIDPVNLIVIVNNGGTETQFTVPTHGWENGHALEWIHATVDLSSVNVDSNSSITIRQTEWPESTANRWYLDNIKLVQQ